MPPVTGIYMAFFPVLIYLIFGTSRHNSMGTFAVICMMVGKVVSSHSSILDIDIVNTTTPSLASEIHNTKLETSRQDIATAITFMVSLMQLTMYCLRLGAISAILSEALISGFTTGTAVHVFTFQIKDLFGLELLKRKGVFKVILTYYDTCKNINNINTMAILISSVTIIIIVSNNKVLKPQLSKYCTFPLPIEIIVVILGTIVSIYGNLKNEYGISTVGIIPVGFPKPNIPPMEILPSIIIDSFIITMISYAITMSMALKFAQKLNYDVDSNQELIALGLGNLLGSFFSCMPFCTSLSRSLIQQTVGGRTQMASFISCGILFFVLLWIGPFFEPLPKCVLASIIIVALKDATIWITTFLSVIIFDIEYGLLIGVLLCVTNLVFISLTSYTCTLALLPGTEFYLDTNRFKRTMNIPGLKIFHYSGGLNFFSRHNFKKKLNKITGIILEKQLLKKKNHNNEIVAYEMQKLKVLILDLSLLLHIDISGLTTLQTIVDDYGKVDVFVLIAGCFVRITTTYMLTKYYGSCMYPCTHTATLQTDTQL